MPIYNVNLKEEYKVIESLEHVEKYLQVTHTRKDYDPEKIDFMIGQLKAIIIGRIGKVIRTLGGVMLQEGKISMVIE